MSKGIVGVLLLAMATVGFAAGCGGDKKEGDKAATGGDSVGIAECDEYLKKAEACTSKMPAEGKAGWESGIKTSRETWKASASGPGKDAIKTSCKAALDGLNANPACK